jgi:hypothetical protein
MTRYIESRTESGIIQIDDNDFCVQQVAVDPLSVYYKATENVSSRYYGQGSQTVQAVYVYGSPILADTIYAVHNPSSTPVNVWFSQGYPYYYYDHDYRFVNDLPREYNLVFVNSPSKDIADALELISYRKQSSVHSLKCGLEIYDENGAKIFNTADRPFRIKNAGSYKPQYIQGYQRGYSVDDFWNNNQALSVSSDRPLCVWFGRMSGMSAVNNSGDRNHDQGEAIGCRLTNKSVIISPNITAAMRSDVGYDRFPWCVQIENGATHDYEHDHNKYYEIPYYINYR